mgnify:CR=1 FL=1
MRALECYLGKVVGLEFYAVQFVVATESLYFFLGGGVSIGPGRGSAAGSVVAYCLGITQIDPLKYDLLFERFLNPDRISLPDIDIDFMGACSMLYSSTLAAISVVFASACGRSEKMASISARVLNHSCLL